MKCNRVLNLMELGLLSPRVIWTLKVYCFLEVNGISGHFLLRVLL